jgi:outer membrane protein OmpA-like peptidoglycan-associated protein
MFHLPSLHRFVAPLLAAAWLAACQTPPPERAPAPAAYSGPVLAIQQAERGVEILLPSSALFEVGKSTLNTQEVGPYLDRLAYLIKAKSNKAVLLEGHADNVGDPVLNQKLSEERAAEIRKGLAARGVPEQRIQTAGFAARRPVASNTTAEGRQLNRRVEVVLLDEKVENITRGEPTGAFASAWDQLKRLIDQGVVKPVEK